MDMSNKRLLELAAAAAGHTVDFWDDGKSYGLSHEVLFIDGVRTWNPLVDDGDALRLAVMVGISIDPRNGAVCAISRDEKHVVIEQGLGGSLLVATRRAIVLVAAKIAEMREAE